MFSPSYVITNSTLFFGTHIFDQTNPNQKKNIYIIKWNSKIKKNKKVSPNPNPNPNPNNNKKLRPR